MKYFCLQCSTVLQRSQVEKYPDQPPDTEYRKHINCPRADIPHGLLGTAIIVDISNPEWDDGDDGDGKEANDNKEK